MSIASGRVHESGHRLNRSCVRASAVSAVLMIAALLAASSAVAQEPLSDFADVPEDAYYAQAVQSLADDGVFTGTECSDGFCPGEAVDRRTIAVWLVRILDGADPDPITESRFNDVDAESFYAPFIERLADLEVTRGCGDGGGFCPDRTVTRSHMAAFLSRAFKLANAADPGFFDVPEDAWYRADIARLAAARITVGCGNGTRFCPQRDTTRAQMATFIARATGRVEASRGDAPAVLLSYEVPPTMGGYWPLPSPDRSHVAYHAGGPGSSSPAALHAANADGTGLRRISSRAAGDEACLREGVSGRCGNEPVIWSPDSSRFLYFHFIFDVGWVLHVANADGSNPMRIAEGDFDRDQLGWSPDSTRITFGLQELEPTSEPDSYVLAGVELYTADANGNSRALLTEGPQKFKWSPDGTRIAYTTTSATLFTIDVEGTNRSYVGDGVSAFKWSPDGTRIAYTTASNDVHLFTIDADGTNRAQLTDNPLPAPEWPSEIDFEWSPDGERIAYTTANGALHVIEADGANPKQLDDDVSRHWWSPDGARIAYTTASGALNVTGADGANPKQLDENVRQGESGSAAVAWSPEGRRLAFLDAADTGTANESAHIVVVNAAYGERLVVDTKPVQGYECMLIDLRWTAGGIAVDLRPPSIDEPLPGCSQ